MSTPMRMCWRDLRILLKAERLSDPEDHILLFYRERLRFFLWHKFSATYCDWSRASTQSVFCLLYPPWASSLDHSQWRGALVQYASQQSLRPFYCIFFFWWKYWVYKCDIPIVCYTWTHFCAEGSILAGFTNFLCSMGAFTGDTREVVMFGSRNSWLKLM